MLQTYSTGFKALVIKPKSLRGGEWLKDETWTCGKLGKTWACVKERNACYLNTCTDGRVFDGVIIEGKTYKFKVAQACLTQI